MKYFVKIGCAVVGSLLMTGCDATLGSLAGQQTRPSGLQASVEGPNDADLRPKPRPDAMPTIAPKPAQTAHTAEQFDTTTSAQRADAVVDSPQTGERLLGSTVGSLGDPTQPGFWLKTPLVTAVTKGRVKYPATGKSVAVDLIPIEGPKTAGSRVSLAALRLLGAPLTGLPTLAVFTE